MDKHKIFIYGYGNPGRQDDGLGPALISRLELEQLNGVVTESNYQLNIEDAFDISESSVVIFVDASLNVGEPFSFNEIEPSEEISFTTHSMSPQSVLALCSELYNKTIKAYILAIRGYSWEFVEELTPGALKNLEKAHIFLKEKIDQFMHAADNNAALLN